MNILLTGFEPFGGEIINPAWEVARALDGEMLGQTRIVARQLPCVFGQSLRVLDEALAELRPGLVLALGQAGGRSDLSLERIAINVDDARIADNAGVQPIDVPVLQSGPAAYFSTLPIKAIVHGLRAAGLPASVSQSAGTFVCNHLFYGLQHRLAGSGVRSGFLHIPYLPEQAARSSGQPSMALVSMIEGVRQTLVLTLQTEGDLRQTGGAIA